MKWVLNKHVDERKDDVECCKIEGVELLEPLYMVF